MSDIHSAPAGGPHGREPGLLIRWPHRYDLLVAAGFAGRGKRIRTQIGDVLGLLPGQRVLDVGCAPALSRSLSPNASGPRGRSRGWTPQPR